MSAQPRRPAEAEDHRLVEASPSETSRTPTDQGTRTDQGARTGPRDETDPRAEVVPRAWDLTGGDWLPLAGESLHRDALREVVAPFPDRVRLTWAVLVALPDARGSDAADSPVAATVHGRVVGWLRPEDAAALARALPAGATAFCPAVVTRLERGDWVVDLRVDRAVLDGRREPHGTVAVDELHPG